MALVEIELDAGGMGKIVLDGVNISHLTHGLEFSNDVRRRGNPNQLKLLITPIQYEEFIKIVADVKDITIEAGVGDNE